MRAFDSTQWQHERQLAEFDRLLESLRSWVNGLPAWPPFDRAKALWSRIGGRLTELQVSLDRVLVVGVVGGSGVGKSTLINALVGEEVCAAGDVERPTTKRPVIIHHPAVDVEFLELDEERPEVHEIAAPLLESMVLVDCPDPDTQASEGVLRLPAGRELHEAGAGENRNREILRRVLPRCDVLIHVGTAQKYKTEAVLRELADHAPGRQIVFVQTHAATDADIREDWRRFLEKRGFEIPLLFRIDSAEALVRRERGEGPPAEFGELVDFLRRELAERGRARIKRANALDLVEWYLDQVQSDVESNLPAVARLESAVGEERARMFAKVRGELERQLREHRRLWRTRLLRETTERWGWGPFASFVRLTSSAGSLVRLLPLMRARGLAPLVVAGGIGAGKAVMDRWRESVASGEWAADVGVSAADIAESRSVLEGLARNAGLGAGGRSADGKRPTDLEESLAGVSLQLHGQVERALADLAIDRSRRRAGAVFHFVMELLFLVLPGYLLGRLAYNFFYEHIWERAPLYGLDFLVQALLWTIVWGLLLRGLLVFRLQRGLTRDIRSAIDAMTPQSALGPIFTDLEAEAHEVERQAERLAEFRAQTGSLRKEIFSGAEAWLLGRLRTA
jgi:hypothetical protein